MLGSRRQFFSQFARMVVGQIESAAGVPRSESAGPEAETDAGRAAAERGQQWLRPPGALPEEAFLKTCTQCTDCQTACPYSAIRRLGPEFGQVGGTPAVIPTESPCYLCEDMPCIAACEPGALLPTAPRQVRMGTAVVDLSACYLSAGQPCDYCVNRCPLKNEAIRFGPDGLPQIQSEACAGCGVCAYLCPPDAISIDPARP